MVQTLLVLSFSWAASLAAASYSVKPFKVDFSAQLPHLKTLLSTTRVSPRHPVPGSNDSTFGITTTQFAHLRNEWVAFDWRAEQAHLNSCVRVQNA